MPINFKTLSAIRNILLQATKHRRREKTLQTRKNGRQMVVNILLQQFPNVSIKLKNVPSSKEASTIGLEFNYQIRDSQISLFFQMSQDTGSEENLGLTNTI